MQVLVGEGALANEVAPGLGVVCAVLDTLGVEIDGAPVVAVVLGLAGALGERGQRIVGRKHLIVRRLLRDPEDFVPGPRSHGVVKCERRERDRKDDRDDTRENDSSGGGSWRQS